MTLHNSSNCYPRSRCPQGAGFGGYTPEKRPNGLETTPRRYNNRVGGCQEAQETDTGAGEGRALAWSVTPARVAETTAQTAP
jgi:hypothetical protein